MNRIIHGDCRDVMRTLIADGVRVQCVVTSPPYWGLRDYGMAGQLGLEASPAEYVASMVDVFGLVRELLADDGTLWLNMGDSYNAGTTAPSQRSLSADVGGWTTRSGDAAGARRVSATGLKTKDLCGIPWRVAFALQAAGWYLRQDIIWSKPNPMPESVTDRCTKAHEYLFLMAKSERYYYDAEAIKEPATKAGQVLHSYGTGAKDRQGATEVNDNRTKIGLANWNQPQPDTRNKRSVWTITTQPYPEAHFATFPEALVEPCILAGSRPGDIVFDPFMGSGTVASVAQRLGRKWLGAELNSEYVKLIGERTRGTIGLELFNE